MLCFVGNLQAGNNNFCGFSNSFGRPISSDLSAVQLKGILENIFKIRERDTTITFMVDYKLPDALYSDKLRSRFVRNNMVFDWANKIEKLYPEKTVQLIAFKETGQKNADLPKTGYRYPLNNSSGRKQKIKIEEILKSTDIVFAMPQYSATAPLHLAADKYGTRVASMGAYQQYMNEGLKIDFSQLRQRCAKMKTLLERTSIVHFAFKAKVDGNVGPYKLKVDVLDRPVFVDDGDLSRDGALGNLPAGETFLAPVEGEISRTEGLLPIQLGEHTVVYRIEKNRALEVLGKNPQAQKERELLEKEPAYGNIAEIGLGFLKDMKVEAPTFDYKDLDYVYNNTIFLEKFGPHIAFGRSDHFQGTVSPKDFNGPAIHIDRTFTPEVQPDVELKSIKFELKNGNLLTIFARGQYQVF